MLPATSIRNGSLATMQHLHFQTRVGQTTPMIPMAMEHTLQGPALVLGVTTGPLWGLLLARIWSM